MPYRTFFKVDIDLKIEGTADNTVRAHVRKVLTGLLKTRAAALAEDKTCRDAKGGDRRKH